MKTKKNKTIKTDDGLVINVVNQIITLFPELENKKDTIINKLTNTNNIDETQYSDIIFDKIILNDIIYYKDKTNYLWDANASIVGVYIDDNTYYLFNEINEIEKEINETMKYINDSIKELFYQSSNNSN
jgi:hypothetical protein